MSRLTSESGRLPDAEQFASQARGRKKKSLRQRIAKQVAMGILCSCIATTFYNIAPIKKAVLWICSVVVHVGGDPLSGKDGIVTKIEDKLDKAIEKTPHVGVPRVGVPAVSPLHKSPEQLKAEADLKEAERKRQEESKRKSVMAELESLKVPFDSEGSLEKLQVELKVAKEMLRKKPLLIRADKAGVHVDPKDPYDVIEKQVKEAEQEAGYQEALRQNEKNLEVRAHLLKFGPNARCPNSKCHYQFHTDRKNGEYRCPKCRAIWPITQAKANMPPPPMPLYPKRDDPHLLDRVKKILGR